jgi:hypothetical protein
VASFDEVIPPGQAGKVTAAVRTDGLAGTVSKVVTVTTDDPGRPTFPLTIRATIVASVDFFPARSMFLGLARSEGAAGKVLVRKNAGEKGTLEVTGLTSSATWLKVSARKVEVAEPQAPPLPPAQPSDWVIEARVEGEPRAGQVPAQVKFKTGLQREPEVDFQVVVRVPPPLSFSVPLLDLPYPGDPAQPVKGTVYVQLGSGQDGKGLSVESISPAFRAVVEQVDPRSFKVDITWTPIPGDTSREGAVVAKLGSLSTSMAVRVPAVAVAPPAAPPPVASPRLSPPVPPKGDR